MRAAGNAGSEAAMRAFVDFWNHPGAFDAMDPAWQESVRLRADTVAANFDALERATFPLNAVRAVSAPTLMMVGSATQPCAQRIAAKLFDVLPLAALATIHGAGHMLPFAHAEPVNDRIRSAYTRGRRRGDRDPAGDGHDRPEGDAPSARGLTVSVPSCWAFFSAPRAAATAARSRSCS